MKIDLQKLNALTELKENIPTLEIAHKLGLTLTKSGSSYKGDCPTGHSSTGHQCFCINSNENYYHCFQCNTAGDNIELVRIVQLCAFNEAIQWLAKEFRPDLLTELQQIESERSPQEIEYFQKATLFQQLYEYGKMLLYEPEGKVALAGLVSRGYSEANLKQSEWIYWPNTVDIKKYLTSQYPNLNRSIDKLPLNGSSGDNFRMAFPYRDRSGRITGFVKRSTERNGVNGVRYDSSPGLKKDDLFGLNKIQRKEDCLIVVEGYPDALYLPTLGLTNIVAIGQGVLSEQHLVGLQARKIKRVVIAFDNDTVGPTNTEKALDLLAEADIEAYVIDPALYGSFKDPDEFVVANGIDPFTNLATNAVSGARWYAKRALTKYDLTSDSGKKSALSDSFDYAARVNNPLDTKDIIDIVSSGLCLTTSMLEPYFQEYQEHKAQEEYKTSTGKLLNKASILLQKNEVTEVMDLLSTKPRDLAMEYQMLRVNAPESFGKFLQSKRAQDMLRVPGSLLGYDLTRFKSISKHLSGIQPGYYILAADPNVGKTAFLVNLAIDLLNSNPDVSVFFYSLDDDRGTIVNRMLAMLTGIEINNVQCKQADAKHQVLLDQAYDYLNHLYERKRLIIKDIAELNDANDIELDIRKIKNKEHVIVFIDGLYNLNVAGESKSVREENIKRAMRMKEITKTYKIPLITTAEIRKKQQSDEKNKPPSMHEIMETGKYAYNADVIWMLSPMNYDDYAQQDEPAIILKFDKNKLAAYKGTMELKFIRAKSTVEETTSTFNLVQQLIGATK